MTNIDTTLNSIRTIMTHSSVDAQKLFSLLERKILDLPIERWSRIEKGKTQLERIKSKYDEGYFINTDNYKILISYNASGGEYCHAGIEYMIEVYDDKELITSFSEDTRDRQENPLYKVQKLYKEIQSKIRQHELDVENKRKEALAKEQESQKIKSINNLMKYLER